MARKKLKVREALKIFASLIGEKQKRAFVDALALHYQSISPFAEDASAPEYRKIFDEVVEIIENVVSAETATYRYAPEQIAAPTTPTTTPMNDEDRDLCEQFFDAAERYCNVAFGSRFFTDDFQDAFNAAIIIHYSTFGASAFLSESGRFFSLSAFAKTVQKELRTLQREREKAPPGALDGDVAAPVDPSESFPAPSDVFAFLESLKPRRYDPILVAVFGSTRDGLSYLNPGADGAVKKALERERRDVQELLAKRFPVDDFE